jgi:protein-S-isoprenylcysteine O-methyltransferase Ste14
MNLGFLLFSMEVFGFLPTFIPILLINILISIDIVMRPLSRQKDEFNRPVIVLSFLTVPFILYLPYYEYKILTSQFFPLFTFDLMFFIGTACLLLGGSLLFLSRKQLGKYGGSKIVIENEHQLITSGLYHYIRHPVYLGFLILFSGYSVALGSIIMMVIITGVFLLLFIKRMNLEEKLLLSQFGDEYLNYMKRTKRLIPFLY